MKISTKPEDITIRVAQFEDCETIHKMIVELASYLGKPEMAQCSLTSLRQHGFGINPLYEAIIAEVDGEAVGLSLFLYDFSSMRGEVGVYIQDLYVAEHAQRLGIGKRLINETVIIGAKRNATHMRLSVPIDNLKAQKLYQSVGLKIIDDERICESSDEMFKSITG